MLARQAVLIDRRAPGALAAGVEAVHPGLLLQDERGAKRPVPDATEEILDRSSHAGNFLD